MVRAAPALPRRGPAPGRRGGPAGPDDRHPRSRPGDRNGEARSDADLSTLALPAERYRHITEDIRAEYAHIPEEALRKGRRQVLLALLEGPGVFRTAAGRRRWEGAARANMLAELVTLGS